MKKSKFGRRILAFLLVFVMMVSLLPLSVMAAKYDIVTGSGAGDTGIAEETLNKNGTINWPIKVYDYLADGMLFEFAQNDDKTMYSSNKSTSEVYAGQYVLGNPMPPIGVGHDFTTDYVYTGQKVNTGYSTEDNRYVKTKMPAVDYQSPQYMRITTTGAFSNYTSDMNCCIANFSSDNGGSKKGSAIRYMVMVYRSNGIYDSGSVPAFKMNVANSSLSGWNQSNALVDVNGNKMTNSADWRYIIIDIKQSYDSSNWNNMNSGTPVGYAFIRLVQDSASDYFDLSHIGFFDNTADATTFGEQCMEFHSEPGEYISGTYWNGICNDAFGMLHPSNGAAWNTGGGNALTSTNGGNYAGYYTHSIGYRMPDYASSASTYNSKRLDGRDSATGRYNGTGNQIGNSNYIYYMAPKTFMNSDAYQEEHPGATSFDMSEMEFDGYSLLTKGTKGVWTAGLLEGSLGVDGTPVYRQETVEYIADLLSKTLVIPRKASNGYNNYNFIAGVKNREQYGYSLDANGNEVANDLAQGLRNCLDISFTGNTKAAAPTMGTYAETLEKASKLKGAFLTVAPNIDTCIDAAYYLLNNLFVANSYNQEQDDFQYLTLSSAQLDNGTNAYVFDGGFSNGATLEDLENGDLTQTEYKAQTQSAVEYNGYDKGGDGTISLKTVNEKDLFYYSWNSDSNSGSTTTRYPFLPVTDAEGVYAGDTDSYYFAEDGKRSYTTEYGTYKNRNYNYVLASNGEFVYHEEDNLFFEFEGDDDVYLFLNGQLVLDLGGGHSISACSFNVNDYVTWARKVLQNPSKYSEAEIERAEALDLDNGDIANFDFYYMERHGYGANMRIITNMHITDPALRVEKTAYQGKQLEYGGIVDADDPIEYNFKLSNTGNSKLYNLTFDDENIGVSLTPDKGLFVVGDDTSSELDDINGYYVTDARGERLDAQDLTAIVSGYQNVGSGGNYIQSGHKYTKVEDGAGTHIYYDGITVNFADNNALKNFLKTMQSEYTDGDTVDEEQTHKGSGLWVDASVTFKGIYYTMTKEQEEAGMFDNTVLVTATTRVNSQDAASETRRSEARHRVYVTAIPSYYQWAGHDLYISKKRVLDDASAEAGNTSSMLHDYITFFTNVNGDISKFGTKLCDRLGNAVANDYYKHVTLGYAAGDGTFGYKTCYPDTGIHEFYILMYLYGESGDVKTMDLGEYAIVRVLIIVADVEDSEYVLDYGLSTENLDAQGELFKNDELYGSLSGTEALLMGVTNKEPSYMNVTSGGTDFNRINFDALDLSENHKIQTEDGYYNVNILIPENGKKINYDEFSGMYTLTESGTITIHVDCPAAWQELNLYYWYDDGRNNVWPGEKMTKTSHGNFEMAIPGNVPHIIISNGTNQTVDLHLNTGQDAWVEIPGTLNDSDKFYASVEYKTADGIIHANVPEDWGDVYVYCWDAFGHGLHAWPGEKVEEIDENGFYTYTIPGDITNVIVNNGDNGKQTDDLIVYAGAETWITVNSTPDSENEETGISYYGATSSRSTETVTMHAKVPSDWEGASLYYWNSNGSATGVDWPGIAMTKGDDGYYHIEGIPADVTNVVINDGNTEKAKQTHNLSITPGVETWFNVNVKSGDGETIVKANVPTSWSKAHVYFFDNNGNAVGGTWPGREATKVSDGVFTSDVPSGATKYIVSNGSDQQTQDMLLILGSTNEIEYNSYKNAISVAPTKLHIEPDGASWSEAYVHYWTDGKTGGSEWPGEKATKNNDGTFSFTIPAGFNKFLVHNGGDIKTPDITEFYMNIENHVTVHSDSSYRVGMPYETEIVYGENAEKEGFTFTPTGFMDSYYSIWMAVTVHENKVDDDDEGDVIQNQATALGNPINIGKEVQMYKKVTVLPANVVYYEDDFAGIKYNTAGTNVLTHYGNGSGSLSQSVNQNQQYGQDTVYQGSENDEVTGGSLTEVLVKDTSDFATFEFTGTGFEIIGHTHAVESGTIRVVVKDKDGNIVADKRVITEFDNGADGGTESISAVPVIRISGLEHGTYTVAINGVPVLDFSNWKPGMTTLPTKTSYLYIDGIRIYQPLKNDKSTNVAIGAEYDAKPYTDSTYTASLTDGKFTSSYQAGVNDSEWFGFKNTGDASTGNITPGSDPRAVFIVTLAEETEVTKVRFHHYKGENLGTFSYINVYTSTDGTTYKYIQTINPDSTKTGAYWATLDFATPTKAKYVKFALSAPVGNPVLVNEVEIYGNVLTVGADDAYPETENGATFNEIRNLIIDRQAFAIKYDDAAGLSVSGGTSTWIENRNNDLPSGYGVKWTNNEVNSVQDYLLAGPNNEVYMMESTESNKTALAFYVQEVGSQAHNMQIAVRALDYGSFIGSEQTGLLNAEIQYGAMVDGALVWKHLTTTVSTAEQYFTIPYTECPYDEENDRYQVVIRVGDTDITGMASYTSVKLNGLKTLELNTTEVPDVVYKTEDINNTIVDSNGNTLETSKFVNFAGLATQMMSNVVMYRAFSGDTAPEGVDTSALGALYHSFTADNTTDFVLTQDSKIYIVTDSEDNMPSAQTIETAQLVQSQFMADELPSAEPLEIVWGLEKYASEGDIIIYADASGYSAEKYKLEVTDRAKVYAGDDNGLLYALNTLQKHFRYAKTNAVEGFTIEDYPQTAERTVHLDVARKYLTKDWINNYIKEMSWMGYNALELHFSEDGGFRADFWDSNYFVSANGNDFSWVVGSRTQYWVNDPYKTDPDAGKYLTAAELIEICNTAKQYNIEIIPSFDTPAHVDWLTWNHYNNYSANGIANTFNYNGTTYTLPTYINHRTTSTSNSRWAVLNLGDDTVQKFSFALYKDIADFFTQYAGSTKFNIGGDEVALTTSDTWNYATFYTYINNLNTLLNNEGYTVRMYNDFLDRSTYINQLPSGTTMPTLASNIEIVYWTADGAVQPASNFESQNRKMYNGMNYWTYYVLRIADASSVGSANKGRDARDPNCTWWSFYRNQEDHVYNEWNPTLFSAYNASTKYTIWDDQLAGGYFMVWNDYAALNTEVEMWNGVYDRTGVSGTSNNFYSLIDRMWSNSIKQWNWGIHNSTYNGNQTTFARYEALRDKLGLFPGYVKTTSGSYAQASNLPAPTAVDDEAFRTRYTVTFRNYNGEVLDTQIVKEGFDATAPANPTRPNDVWYDYTFTGWDKDFSNITADTVVTAQYSSQATTAGKIGYLEVMVSGGTNFTMSIDGGTAKPMGVKYVNPSMEFGKAVTLVAQTTNTNKFVGWFDAKNGELLTTSANYTFFTSGNDVFMAVYDKTFGGTEGLVTFRNDKTNQILDIQYYSSTDTINFPADISYPGYEFAGWSYTEAQIKELLSQGKDVTVTPVWRAKDVYFTVNVNGGSVAQSNNPVGGKYIGYKSMTVIADDAPDGMKFVYWIEENDNILSYNEEYKFYPYKDTTLTAVFVSKLTIGIGVTGTKPLPEVETPAEKDTFTVYFENNWNWTDVSIYYWGVEGSPEWYGVPMNFLENNGYYDVYTYEVPLGITGMVINGIRDDGSGNRDQTPDIKDGFVDGRLYRMVYDNGNKVEIDDSRVSGNTQPESNTFYLYASEEWAAQGAWFAAYGWTDDESENIWLKLEHVGGNIYKGELPVRFCNLVLVRMNSASDELSFDNKLAQTSDLTISPTDEHNMIIITTGNSFTAANMITMFFVNELDWTDVKAYYTDKFGTHEVEMAFVEKDENGKDVYSFIAPETASKLIFTDGSKNYIYTSEGTIADRTIFSFIDVDNKIEQDITVNVGIDTTTMGDSNIVVFEWCTPAELGFTFVNTGLMLVEADKYIESTFVKGTMDINVIQFAPAKKYQTSSGTHSVTVPQVAKGDSWIVCAFVQYRDENGVLHTKYSKQVTGTK